uniref:VQ domain-containing protein n=1 Tax=Salix viminalis TaxID=40686 RepID=A0A6N2LR79_SALVM
MEANNNSSTSLTSSSSMYSKQYSEETKGLKMPQSYHLSLHSIRKPQMKPGKKPIAPLPPTPPRVYKVDPINFRDLVQKLTGAPEPDPQHQPRLQSVAPPPLDLATPALFSRDSQLLPSPAKTISTRNRNSIEKLTKTPLSTLYWELMSESLDVKPKKISDSLMAVSSSLELNLSPSSHAWCAFPLLSPGTLSGLEQRTVL